MTISRDPDKVAEIPLAMITKALGINQHVISIILDEPNAKVGDAVGMQLFAITPFVPQIGSRIRTEDGIYCVVKDVVFTVGRGSGYPNLVVNVMAEREG